MLVLVFLAAAVSGISAQIQNNRTLCECALFGREDKAGERNQYLIGYLGTPDAPESDCDAETLYDTQCYSACEEIGRIFKLGSGHCESKIQENQPQCFGDSWCERIASAAPGFDSDGTWVVQAFVALRQCPGKEDFEFTEVVQQEGLQKVCCAAGQQAPCDANDCECAEATYPDCECGLFIPEMFGKFKPNPNVDPLPLSQVGTQFNGSDWNANCFMFPSAIDSPDIDYCSEYCFAKEDDLVEYSLSDPHPNNPEYTYGQFMCAGLFAKVSKYEAFENQPLEVYGRVQRCPGAGIGWASFAPFGTAPELLCCDANGIWYQCP